MNTSEAISKARTMRWTASEVDVLIEFMESSERGFIR
jgi:hypothetical protein